MKLHELFNQTSPSYGMNKLSSEQIDGIMKRAGEIVQDRITGAAEAEEIAKIAAAELEKLDFADPELQKTARELYAYGAGLADGEMIVKQAMVAQIYDEAYNTFISKIAEVMGEEAAEQVDGALREAGGEEQVADDEVAAVQDEIAENVAGALVEQAGGMEQVQQDPELSAEIVQTADEVAAQIVEEQLGSQ